MSNKILALLGFASRAGKLSCGMNAAIEAIFKGKSKLCIAASDISAKSLKEINFHAVKNNVRVIILDDCNINTLSAAIGRRCGILSVNDNSFADGIIGAANNRYSGTDTSIQGGNANGK